MAASCTEAYSRSAAAPKASAENCSDDALASALIRARRASSPQKADRYVPNSRPSSYCQPFTPSSTTPSTQGSRRHSTGTPAARASK